MKTRATTLLRRSALLSALAALLSLGAAQAADVEYALVIHGGAGDSSSLSPPQRAAREATLKKALLTGRQLLAEGGSSLDVVERVIRILEDDPLFNAGRGAVLNSAGGHELDASIMDGRAKACGAVAGVQTVKNPISLARLVMTETPHVLLAGAGAEQFATEMDVDRVEQSYFRTEEAVRRWRKVRAQQAPAGAGGKDRGDKQSHRDARPPASRAVHYGTVGCVALDRQGNLAAGTSTGGLTNKKFGRVGDSPIVGAGTYADNATCAVSCTGIGEQYIRHAVAYDISARLAYRGSSLQEAVSQVLRQRLRPGDGGVIAVGRDGSMVMDFTTKGMARAAADSTGRMVVELGAK